MPLIYFNNLLSIEQPDFDLAGLYRVIAISNDNSQVALAPINIKPKSDSNQEEKDKTQFRGVATIRKIEMSVLQTLEEQGYLHEVELIQDPILSRHSSYFKKSEKEIYDYRLKLMKPFFSYKNLAKAIFSESGIGKYVAQIKSKYGCSRTLIYKLFGLLCVYGFVDSSLSPMLYKCGAPGIRRPCNDKRKKSGRKTNRERLGLVDESPQRGITEQDQKRMLELYKKIAKPGMSDRELYNQIITTLFVKQYTQTKDGLIPVIPPKGTFPNYSQFLNIINYGIKKVDSLLLFTTQGHHNRNLRGLKGKAWQNVAGPGHTYAIDSTIADIFLRSSVNRAWVAGRPIVYIMVDVWSTAIVGFYVCWTGPSWAMAKVALFTTCANRHLLSSLWGFDDQLWLDPIPTLPFEWLCDRGEYLSNAALQTALETMFSLAYNPSRRPDLKGLVEVLHRIAKDAQYAFVPGAIDARRKELELRGNGKNEAMLTLPEYVKYLTIIFNNYNMTSDRSYRLDADMLADSVDPTPSGLWTWGHKNYLGYRKSTPEVKLINNLLPTGPATLNRGGFYFSGLQYEAEIANAERWTANARNFGGSVFDVNYYPGSNSHIWLADHQVGNIRFNLSSVARAKPHTSIDEWLDAVMVEKINSQDREYSKTYNSLIALAKANNIIKSARELTLSADMHSSDPLPSIREARKIEVASEHATQQSISPELSETQFDVGLNGYNELMQSVMALSIKSGE